MMYFHFGSSLGYIFLQTFPPGSFVLKGKGSYWEISTHIHVYMCTRTHTHTNEGEEILSTFEEIRTLWPDMNLPHPAPH